jgi:hypothetical protein
MKPVTTRLLMSLIFGIAVLLAACTPATHYRAPTYAEITPGPHKAVPDLSTTIEVPPFPYSTPLPPPVPTSLDGLYSRVLLERPLPASAVRAIV